MTITLVADVGQLGARFKAGTTLAVGPSMLLVACELVEQGAAVPALPVEAP